jgi:ABC-type uncharacterized transport system permease subunit
MQDIMLTDPAATLRRARLLFWIAAFLSLGFALGLWAIGNEGEALFVGAWPPGILAVGAVLTRRARRTGS